MNLKRNMAIIENSTSWQVGMNMAFAFEELVAQHKYARQMKRSWWRRI